MRLCRTSRIVNAARLRLKESDRLASSAAMLAAVGIASDMASDSLAVHGTSAPLRPLAPVDPCADHRIAMSAAVLATAAEAPLALLDSSCSAKSYPSFFPEFLALQPMR